MIDTKSSFEEHFPTIQHKLHPLFYRGLIALLRKVTCEKPINEFIALNKGLKGADFIESSLERLEVSYTISNKDREKIPSSGGVVIVANHPLGGLDALALLKLVTDVRSDVKIVANGVLTVIEPIRSLLIPVDTFGSKTSKGSLYAIREALKNEQALIVFPSGEVSRATPWGLKDRKWQKGFLKFASEAKAPILPILIHAKNSSLFYMASFIFRPLSTLMLPSEMFTKNRDPIRFYVGDPIPFASYNIGIELSNRLKLLRKHLYGLAKNKRSIFVTEKTISAPENRKILLSHIRTCEHLGSTHDGKDILCASFSSVTPLLKEIGRLREITFRKVQEGSGHKRDLDEYDLYYQHIIVWDPKAMEIVGAYRIGVGSQILNLMGVEGFYTHSLFDFKDEFLPFLPTAIELGRSFVQPAYWGSRALDYLWQGIGAFLAKNPHIKTMFGPVSISASYPKEAIEWLVGYYGHHYAPQTPYAKGKTPLIIPHAQEHVHFESPSKDFKSLKEHLGCYNLSVPTLYKHYTDLCEEGGVCFHDFNVDMSFGGCVDGFIVVDVDTITPTKRSRYIEKFITHHEEQ